MKLTYEFLKENVVEVEVINELNMGDIDDFLDATNGVIIPGLMVDDNNDAIIEVGTKGKFNVQPHNNWYELSIGGCLIDIAIDEDELNNYIKGIRVVGQNEHFSRKEA